MQESYEAHREHIEQLYLSENPNFCDLHFHRHVELLYALEDGLLVSVNGADRILRKNEVAIIDSFGAHSYPNPAKLMSVALVIPARFCADFTLRMKSMRLSSNFITDPEACSEILQMIRLLQKHTYNVCNPRYLTTNYSADEEPFVYGCIATIMGIVLRKIPLVPRTQSGDDDLKKEILLYVEENYGETLHLDDMANRFGYSRYYFSKLCNKLFGMSITEYINRVRVLKILEDYDDMKLTALAMKHGFSNMRTFQRSFKSVMGVSPTEYRKHILSKKQNRRISE